MPRRSSAPRGCARTMASRGSPAPSASGFPPARGSQPRARRKVVAGVAMHATVRPPHPLWLRGVAPYAREWARRVPRPRPARALAGRERLRRLPSACCRASRGGVPAICLRRADASSGGHRHPRGKGAAVRLRSAGRTQPSARALPSGPPSGERHRRCRSVGGRWNGPAAAPPRPDRRSLPKLADVEGRRRWRGTGTSRFNGSRRIARPPSAGRARRRRRPAARAASRTRAR